ncbi:hypothetical protein BB559_004038 [Furculomyces boomerangus]|uniref:LIM zinc-binding domain-containing protein n=1 Tax=Furculomyces boomerangus TaxID=61424 RepID=A0A2T9YH44_9FUNG|nr:hypothetical protein BB559_004038 [Furculomyces boomerangus]
MLASNNIKEPEASIAPYTYDIRITGDLHEKKDKNGLTKVFVKIKKNKTPKKLPPTNPQNSNTAIKTPTSNHPGTSNQNIHTLENKSSKNSLSDYSSHGVLLEIDKDSESEIDSNTQKSLKVPKNQQPGTPIVFNNTSPPQTHISNVSTPYVNHEPDLVGGGAPEFTLDKNIINQNQSSSHLTNTSNINSPQLSNKTYINYKKVNPQINPFSYYQSNMKDIKTPQSSLPPSPTKPQILGSEVSLYMDRVLAGSPSTTNSNPVHINNKKTQTPNPPNNAFSEHGSPKSTPNTSFPQEIGLKLSDMNTSSIIDVDFERQQLLNLRGGCNIIERPSSAPSAVLSMKESRPPGITPYDLFSERVSGLIKQYFEEEELQEYLRDLNKKHRFIGHEKTELEEVLSRTAMKSPFPYFSTPQIQKQRLKDISKYQPPISNDEHELNTVLTKTSWSDNSSINNHIPQPYKNSNSPISSSPSHLRSTKSSHNLGSSSGFINSFKNKPLIIPFKQSTFDGNSYSTQQKSVNSEPKTKMPSKNLSATNKNNNNIDWELPDSLRIKPFNLKGAFKMLSDPVQIFDDTFASNDGRKSEFNRNKKGTNTIKSNITSLNGGNGLSNKSSTFTQKENQVFDNIVFDNTAFDNNSPVPNKNAENEPFKSPNKANSGFSLSKPETQELIKNLYGGSSNLSHTNNPDDEYLKDNYKVDEKDSAVYHQSKKLSTPSPTNSPPSSNEDPMTLESRNFDQILPNYTNKEDFATTISNRSDTSSSHSSKPLPKTPSSRPSSSRNRSGSVLNLNPSRLSRASLIPMELAEKDKNRSNSSIKSKPDTETNLTDKPEIEPNNNLEELSTLNTNNPTKVDNTPRDRNNFIPNMPSEIFNVLQRTGGIPDLPLFNNDSKSLISAASTPKVNTNRKANNINNQKTTEPENYDPVTSYTVRKTEVVSIASGASDIPTYHSANIKTRPIDRNPENIPRNINQNSKNNFSDNNNSKNPPIHKNNSSEVSQAPPSSVVSEMPKAPTPMFGRFPSPPPQIRKKAQDPNQSNNQIQGDTSHNKNNSSKSIINGQSMSVIQSRPPENYESQIEKKISMIESELRDSSSTLMDAIRNGQITLPKVDEDDSHANYGHYTPRKNQNDTKGIGNRNGDPSMVYINTVPVNGSASILIPNIAGGGKDAQIAGLELPQRPSSVTPSESVSNIANSNKRSNEKKGSYLDRPENVPRSIINDPPTCIICGNVVKNAKPSNEHVVHIDCMKCETCNKSLVNEEYRIIDGHFFCENHFDRYFPSDAELSKSMNSKNDSVLRGGGCVDIQSANDFIKYMQDQKKATEAQNSLQPYYEMSGNIDKQKASTVEHKRIITPMGSEWLAERQTKKQLQTQVLEKRTLLNSPNQAFNNSPGENSNRNEFNTEYSTLDKSTISSNDTNFVSRNRKIMVDGYTQSICPKCSKSIHPKESVLFDNYDYHKTCLKCSVCHRCLRPQTALLSKNTIYCQYHGSPLIKQSNHTSDFRNRSSSLGTYDRDHNPDIKQQNGGFGQEVWYSQKPKPLPSRPNVLSTASIVSSNIQKFDPKYRSSLPPIPQNKGNTSENNTSYQNRVGVNSITPEMYPHTNLKNQLDPRGPSIADNLHIIPDYNRQFIESKHAIGISGEMSVSSRFNPFNEDLDRKDRTPAFTNRYLGNKPVVSSPLAPTSQSGFPENTKIGSYPFGIDPRFIVGNQNFQNSLGLLIDNDNFNNFEKKTSGAQRNSANFNSRFKVTERPSGVWVEPRSAFQ